MLWKVPLTIILAYAALLVMRREFFIPIAKTRTWFYSLLVNFIGIAAIVIFSHYFPPNDLNTTSVISFVAILLIWSHAEEYIKITAVTLANDDKKTSFSTAVTSAVCFAVIENFLYGISGTPFSVVSRGFYGPILHSFFTLIFVHFLRKKQAKAGFVAAGLIHGLHNTFVMYGIPVADFFLCLTAYVFIVINIRNEQNIDLAKSDI